MVLVVMLPSMLMKAKTVMMKMTKGIKPINGRYLPRLRLSESIKPAKNGSLHASHTRAIKKMMLAETGEILRMSV